MKRFLFTMTMIATGLMAQTQIYVLCEGYFQTPNATVWSFTDDFTGIDGPLYWDPNVNPLGDTGQSLTLDHSDLYIVVNNSHLLKKVDISSGFNPVAECAVPGSSPRYFVTHNGKGYLSTWNLSGILVVDLNSFTVIDTLVIPNTKIEQMLVRGSTLWAASPMHADWSTNDEIYKIDLTSAPTVSDSFAVVPGPNSILEADGLLFISSTYYDDAWQVFSGTSTIDPGTGDVETQDYGVSMGYDDLLEINHTVYRCVPGGLAPLMDDLSVDMDAELSIGGNVYAAAAYDNMIYIATSNYTAPDTITVMDTTGAIQAQFAVGALPGSFAFYNPDLVSIDPEVTLPQSFTLSAGYPNPFNPEIHFDLTVKESASMTIDVVNVTGQTVDQLFSGKKSPGNYELSWHPDQIASDVYFLRVQNGQEIQCRKMVLIK